MVNSSEFSKRLTEILDHYDLSASSFADKIEVGRSSISHILSGRNKPSLDFILKILHAYPEIDLYWLMNGKGNLIKTTSPSSSVPIENIDRQAVKEEQLQSAPLPPYGMSSSPNDKTIERVILCYSDGTFEAFDPLDKIA